MDSKKKMAANSPAPLLMKSADGAYACFGTLKHLQDGFDRAFDLLYWQSRSSQERFDATWELAREYHLNNGMKEDELRLQRTIANFQRLRS